MFFLFIFVHQICFLGDSNSGLFALAENNKRLSSNEKEKLTYVRNFFTVFIILIFLFRDVRYRNNNRSESRTSVASAKTHRMSSGSADKERLSSTFMHSDGSSSTGSAVHSSHDALQSNANNVKNATDSPSTHSSSVQDGLFYRQRELQERLQQANPYAAADSLLRSAAAFDLRPPFPFMGGVPYSGAVNGQLMPGCLPGTAAAAAALHSQLNLLNVSHFDALRIRGLPGPAPGLDPFRGFMDSFNASGNRLPFTADALFRPPIDPMMLEREREQQQQLLQRLQQISNVPTSNQSTLAVSQSSTGSGNANSTNPLASMIDSERAMNRTSSSSSSIANSQCLPGLMPLTQFSTANMIPQLPSMDSPAMAAFYSNLFQRERLEADQRNRFLGYNPAVGMSLAPPPPPPPPHSSASMLPGAMSPAANLDLLRMAMLNGGDPMLARTLAGFNPNGYASTNNQTNMNLSNHQLPAALNNVLTQGNKLSSPFSVTLQQMARRDSVLNSSTPHTNLQNR